MTRTLPVDTLMPRRTFDVAVVGAGAIGLTLAFALTQAGFDTVLIGRPAQVRTGRTVALLEGSVDLLDDLGLWEDLRPRAAALARMKIVDATHSLFRSPPVEFRAEELGREAFGFNIENADLEAGLAGAVEGLPKLTMLPDLAHRFDFHGATAKIAVGAYDVVEARLVVAADGRESLARKMAGIGVRSRAWPQVALTVIFSHEAPHRNVSTEFHTRQGPFTLVPLPAAGEAAHRSSLVWVMSPSEAERRRALSPDAFAATVTDQAGRLLGTMRLESGVGAFPIITSVATRLTGERLVLTGEAAHALPPIGAQGLNLSFRDVTQLVETLRKARFGEQDIGDPAVLDRYAAARQSDVALRTIAVDALNGSLLSRFPLTDLLRGAGLAALGSIGPVRRRLMREGLVPRSRAALTTGGGLDGTDEHRRSTQRF